jgi:PAP2 superfamily
MRTAATIALLFLSLHLCSQRIDTLTMDSLSGKKVMAYNMKDRWLLYPKPKPFAFITKVPRTFRDVAVESFAKKSLPTWGIIAGSTALTVWLDQPMLEGVQNFSDFIGLDNTRIYHDVLDFKIGAQEVTIYEAPGNLNTFIYQIGEVLPSLLLAGGIAVYGGVKKDYRAQSTASQLVQSFLVMGVTTQLMKRISGRESPFVSTAKGGRWHPFVNWKTYQNNVSSYDAFPSGHMATLMSTMVVVAQNYPEKKWVRPVGYAIMGLVGLAMMNNGVHWAGDYPLAIGLGYVVGTVTVRMNRWVRGK